MRFLIVCLTILILNCDFGFSSVKNKNVEELVMSAITSFEKGWYRESIDLFAKLNKQYPFSSYDVLACLKTADAYFELGRYQSAVNMYDNFERMYPCNESMPYVVYRTALAYLKQARCLNNDQACVNKALHIYLKFLERYPKSKYACVVSADIDLCYEKLSGHEFQIGLFYYKNGKYNSARSRFINVISNYNDAGYHRMALFYLRKCELLLGE